MTMRHSVLCERRKKVVQGILVSIFKRAKTREIISSQFKFACKLVQLRKETNVVGKYDQITDGIAEDIRLFASANRRIARCQIASSNREPKTYISPGNKVRVVFAPLRFPSSSVFAFFPSQPCFIATLVSSPRTRHFILV